MLSAKETWHKLERFATIISIITGFIALSPFLWSLYAMVREGAQAKVPAWVAVAAAVMTGALVLFRLRQSHAREATSAQIRVVVNTTSDWYALAFSNSVKLVRVIHNPEFIDGENRGGKTHLTDITDTEPDGFSKSFSLRINRPSTDSSAVTVQLIIRIACVIGHNTVSLRFGKGYSGKSTTRIYDAEENEVFSHLSEGPGERVGNWNEPEASIPFAELLPKGR